MPFQIPSDLHPDCMPLAFLLGRWEGRGRGEYPTIEPYEFGQEVIFSHNGNPFLYYTSRSWLIDEEGTAVRPLAMETGFWRPQPEGKLEVVLVHPTGVAEVWYGRVNQTVMHGRFWSPRTLRARAAVRRSRWSRTTSRSRSGRTERGRPWARVNSADPCPRLRSEQS